MSDSRPVTPPSRRNDASLRDAQLTPEQIRRVELNRLKAKARQREREQAAASTSSTADSSKLNANNKRPLEVTSAASTSPTAGASTSNSSSRGATTRPLRRDARLGKYFDYDLSKMVNSKGGFLVEDEKEATEDLRAKERERERQRAMQNLEPPMSLDPTKNPKCDECGKVDIDQTFRKVLRCLVCHKCKEEKLEKYSLLTKTVCKEDYLLTDGELQCRLFLLKKSLIEARLAELRDEELMPHLLRPNPHKATYSNMMLFLRYQVEDFAWKKWGSPEALDAEFERREAKAKNRKSKKFEEGLKDLRRRTRESVWQRRKDEEHKHVFGNVERGNNGEGRQVCHECGFTIEVEEF